MGAFSIQTKTYEQGRLTFTLSPKYVVVSTPLQRFYLLPKQSYWHKRLNLVRAMIAMGEIRSLDELAAYCEYGIEWRHTSLPLDVLIYTKDIYGHAEV